jgi:RNA polymerase sigma factor (sigma-70 family)
MSSPIPSDAALVLAARRGDHAAWQELVERFGRLLRAICRAHRLNAADTDDVIQTTWVRAVEHIGRIHDADRFASWLATVARRECLRALRRHARVRPCEEEQLHARADPAADPAAKVLEAERRHAVRAAVHRLAPRDRTLLVRLFNDTDPSYADIGRELGMPIGSIGPTRGRILERMRRVEPIAQLA